MSIENMNYKSCSNEISSFISISSSIDWFLRLSSSWFNLLIFDFKDIISDVWVIIWYNAIKKPIKTPIETDNKIASHTLTPSFEGSIALI